MRISCKRIYPFLPGSDIFKGNFLRRNPKLRGLAKTLSFICYSIPNIRFDNSQSGFKTFNLKLGSRD